jgi:hypothetical protein
MLVADMNGVCRKVHVDELSDAGLDVASAHRLLRGRGAESGGFAKPQAIFGWYSKIVGFSTFTLICALKI